MESPTPSFMYTKCTSCIVLKGSIVNQIQFNNHDNPHERKKQTKKIIIFCSAKFMICIQILMSNDKIF